MIATALPSPEGKDVPLSSKKTQFYGWTLLGVAWICYGFGITPASVGWNLLAVEMVEDSALGMVREDVAWIRGVRVLIAAMVAPAVGIALMRWGIRSVMVAGSLIAAFGFFITAQASSKYACLIGYGLIGGFGIGFATILPTQTLASNWFVKYRARAMAFVLTAGGIMGGFINLIIPYTIEHGGWRSGWFLIVGMSVTVAIIAGLFIRNTPESVGQHPDGVPPETDEDSGPSAESQSASPQEVTAPPKATREWTAGEAIRTPQFVLLTITGIAYSAPWTVLMTVGGLHLTDVGFSLPQRGAILATLSFTSTLGRFSGALGDLVPPQRMLALGLGLEALGIGGLVTADTMPLAYACVTIMGVGFGAAYISTPVVFSNFFGRRAFAAATGTRFMIGGVFNAGIPVVVQFVQTRTDSYNSSFVAIMIYGFIGAVIALLVSAPGAPTGPAPSDA